MLQRHFLPIFQNLQLISTSLCGLQIACLKELKYLASNFNEHVTVLSQNASKKLNILSTLTFLMTFNHRM